MCSDIVREFIINQSLSWLINACTITINYASDTYTETSFFKPYRNNLTGTAWHSSKKKPIDSPPGCDWLLEPLSSEATSRGRTCVCVCVCVERSKELKI